MSPEQIPPALYFLAAALLLPLLPVSWRPGVMVAFPLAALFAALALPEGPLVSVSFLHYELVPLRVDGLGRLFAIAFSLVAVVGGIYSWHERDLRQQVAALLYAGGAVGVVLAGDFLTLLLYWEVMAVASAFLVWSGTMPGAGGAGFRYLLFHLFGGALLLAGIIFQVHATGSLEVGSFLEDPTPGTVLILLGVLVNAGMPPFHMWMPDSYPKASVTGAVFLSAFTTKTAVYVLARCFPGWEVLLIVGSLMALYGVYYAILSNDIRQILSYHIVSQVGYMVVAIGVGGEFGINAAGAHAYNHLLYKTLLFMGTGAVLFSVGSTRLTDLGGLRKSMPWVVLLYLIGGASISGFPLTGGFVSKALVMEGVYRIESAAFYLLVVASVGTFLSVGVKLPYFTWFHRDAKRKPQREVPRTMLWAMGILAFLCLLFGMYPPALYAFLPFPEDYAAYTLLGVLKPIHLFLATFVGFWLFRHKLLGPAKIVLDLDWFYRKPAPYFRIVFIDGVNRVFDACERWLDVLAAKTASASRHPRALIGLSPKGRQGDFDPDADRTLLGRSVSLTVLTVVVVIFWTLLF
ncbi:MAG: Na(+)/H(+) antiporter subunit D [Opitutales bacterium]